MKTLSINQKLAIVALVLGLVAVAGPDPYARSYAKVDVKALGLRSDKQADRVEVRALADMLIKGTNETRLIDLRPSAEISAGQLPGAENLGVQEFLASDDLRETPVLLYSTDDMEAAQAWVLARSTGFKSVRIVAGGYKAWRDEVLYPTLETATTAAGMANFEKRKQVSLHFGGMPKIAGVAASAAVAGSAGKQTLKSTKVATPAPGGAPKKKKREGC